MLLRSFKNRINVGNKYCLCLIYFTSVKLKHGIKTRVTKTKMTQITKFRSRFEGKYLDITEKLKFCDELENYIIFFLTKQ